MKWIALLAVFSVGALAADKPPKVAPKPPAPAAEEPVEDDGGITLFDVHRALGAASLGMFSTALVIGAASGNLGKLMDPGACCFDDGGGSREPVTRTIDRVLVNVGGAAYATAGGLALYNLLVDDPPSRRPRTRHNAHRWLAIGHGTAFALTTVTGAVMAFSQDDDRTTFASAARIHTASNIALVLLLTAAYADILFE